MRSQGQLPPAFNRRRCAAEWKGNRFSNERLREQAGLGAEGGHRRGNGGVPRSVPRPEQFVVIRVAIIGCGKIADQHVQAIRRIPGSMVVAACDREPLMAQQLAERFRIEACFDDVGEMLRGAIARRRSRHDAAAEPSPVGRQCLEAGSHVYLEKPFTVTADEATCAGRVGPAARPEPHRRPQLPVHARDDGGCGAWSHRVTSAATGASGKLLVLRSRRRELRRTAARQPQSLGAAACPASCSTTSSATASPGWPSSSTDEIAEVIASTHQSDAAAQPRWPGSARRAARTDARSRAARPPRSPSRRRSSPA